MCLIRKGFLLWVLVLLLACSQRPPSLVLIETPVTTTTIVADKLPATVELPLTRSVAPQANIIVQAVTQTPAVNASNIVVSPIPVKQTETPIPLLSPQAHFTEEIRQTLHICEETEHFVLYCFGGDEAVSADITSQLEHHYESITSHLRSEPKGKIVVEIYPDVQSFHIAVKSPNGPDWFVGKAESGRIQMVTPLNPGPKHTFETVLQVATHEFTHLVVDAINEDNIPIWLDEGIATYEAGHSPNPQFISAQAERNFPDITDLNFNSGIDSGIMYAFSYTMIEFIVQEFGYDYLVELVATAGDFEKVFNLSETEFQQVWREFVVAKYVQ